MTSIHPRPLRSCLKSRARSTSSALRIRPRQTGWPLAWLISASQLGLLQDDPEHYLRDATPAAAGEDGALSAEAIEDLIAQRLEARTDKDWTEADRIRDELDAAGIILEDDASGTRWRRS